MWIFKAAPWIFVVVSFKSEVFLFFFPFTLLQNNIGSVIFLTIWLTLYVQWFLTQRTKNVSLRFLRANALVFLLRTGLPSHPQHELMKRQCTGCPGMITFYIKGNLEHASAFLSNLKVCMWRILKDLRTSKTRGRGLSTCFWRAHIVDMHPPLCLTSDLSPCSFSQLLRASAAMKV